MLRRRQGDKNNFVFLFFFIFFSNLLLIFNFFLNLQTLKNWHQNKTFSHFLQKSETHMNFLVKGKQISSSLSSQTENFLSFGFQMKNQKSRNITCQSISDEKDDFFSDVKKPSFFPYAQKKNFSGSQNFLNPSLKNSKTRDTSFKASTFSSKPSSGNQKPRFPEAPKQQVVSITYEEIGLFPRSFNRVFDRFFKQLFFDVENLVIQEYRFYRYLFLTTVKCLFILFFVPLTVNFFSKTYLIRPITEYYWNTQNHEIFLNSYQQKQAFSEFKNFEEKIYFESFLFSENKFLIESADVLTPIKENQPKNNQFLPLQFSNLFQTSLQKRLQGKIVELANHYNEKSIEAVTNFFADILSFVTLCFLLVRLEIQINITKSFLLEVFFGLDDSKKSLLILFLTDLLVGYHSPNIWELFFQTLFDHYGLPESQTTIFLLVATLPVLLDVLFKYLIFRHLNRASPATVATYHAMIE